MSTDEKESKKIRKKERGKEREREREKERERDREREGDWIQIIRPFFLFYAQLLVLQRTLKSLVSWQLIMLWLTTRASNADGEMLMRVAGGWCVYSSLHELVFML